MSALLSFRACSRPLVVAFLLVLASAVPAGALSGVALAQSTGQFCPALTAAGMICPPIQSTTPATGYISCPDGSVVAATQGCPADVYTTVPSTSYVTLPASPIAAFPFPGQTQSEVIPLPPYEYVWVTNPWNSPAVVNGADVVWVYDYRLGTYYQTSALAPGQGAWVFSYSGGEATLTPVF